MLDNLRKMTSTLNHRGPNDSGYWLDSDAGIALGHRRLATLELSAEGHQPMTSPNQRYHVVCDGKIYNHHTLRRQLGKAGYSAWRGTSDTETLLAAIMHWGIRRALQACVGMFALAVWDNHTQRLTLARDRMGEKPLYYGWVGKHFLFGSELKALRAHPDWTATINREAIASQLRLSYIPAPLTIYQGIYKLAPGQMLQITPQHRTGSEPRIAAYWSLAEHIQPEIERPTRTDAEHTHTLEALLRHAVRQQMLADVPLGAFLSGGVDSALIVALMQNQSNLPVKTFTIGYEDTALNEAPPARAIAKHLGTEHTEFVANSVDVKDAIAQLPSLFDEPFSDMAQIPTLLAAQLARTRVTVSLSGEGADELFGGYKRYAYAQSVWQHLHYLPYLMRNGLAKTLKRWSTQPWDKRLQPFMNALPNRLRVSNSQEKLRNVSSVLRAKTPEDIYRCLISHWQHPEEFVLGVHNGYDPVPSQLPTGLSFPERMMYMDTINYLSGDILTKVERGAIGASLETRAPFLDHRVVEMAWQLPLHLKMRQGQGKWILRQILHHYVPPALIDRPQQNPSVPLGAWLRSSLRDWAEPLLAPSRLQQEGFLDPEPIQKKWREHLAGTHNWQQDLWDVLMFQAWHEQQRQPLMQALAA